MKAEGERGARFWPGLAGFETTGHPTRKTQSRVRLQWEGYCAVDGVSAAFGAMAGSWPGLADCASFSFPEHPVLLRASLAKRFQSHTILWPTEHTEHTEEDRCSVYSVCSVGKPLFVHSISTHWILASSASHCFASGGVPLAVRAAWMIRLNTPFEGEAITVNNPFFIAASNALVAGPHLMVE